MPQLPTGRRIEFSLDRFHALLGQVTQEEARTIAASLDRDEDLLLVMDVVHFDREGQPFFAGCVASEWEAYAADWSPADRQALLAWFASAESRERRAEAIHYIRTLYLDHTREGAAYPYMVLTAAPAGVVAGSSLLQ